MKSIPLDQKKDQIETFKNGLSPDLNSIHPALSSTIVNSCLPARLLAKKVGTNYQFLINAGNQNLRPPKFPLSRTLSLMLASQRFDILQFLAHECGFLLIKIPLIKKDKDFFTAACDLSGCWGKLCLSMREYFHEVDPGKRKNKFSGLLDLCRELTSAAAGLEAAIEGEQNPGEKNGKDR